MAGGQPLKGALTAGLKDAARARLQALALGAGAELGRIMAHSPKDLARARLVRLAQQGSSREVTSARSIKELARARLARLAAQAPTSADALRQALKASQVSARKPQKLNARA